MTHRVFDPALADLPLVLPIFPLPQATLLPGLVLPLNIFEPRYVNMIIDALGLGRMIGMIQPDIGRSNAEEIVVYSVGCAGRITSFQETADGRFLINLTGVCRFSVENELETQRGYRRVRPHWSRFARDLQEPELTNFDRQSFQDGIQAFLDQRGISLEWSALGEFPNHQLIDLLCIQLPLSVEEKQALLEADEPDQRANLLTTMASMAARAGAEDDGSQIRH